MLGLLHEVLVGGERVVPERVQLGAHLAQAVVVDPVDAPGAGALVQDEARVLEDLEVLGDRGPGHGQGVGELTHRAGSRREPGEDGPPRPVTQRSPAINRVSSH